MHHLIWNFNSDELEPFEQDLIKMISPTKAESEDFINFCKKLFVDPDFYAASSLKYRGEKFNSYEALISYLADNIILIFSEVILNKIKQEEKGRLVQTNDPMILSNPLCAQSPEERKKRKDDLDEESVSQEEKGPTAKHFTHSNVFCGYTL